MGEDGQGDRRQEDGGPSLPQVERNGAVQLPAPAALGVRQLQELRGPLPRRLHGRQRRRHAWQGHLLRAEGGGGCRWQEEVMRWRLVQLGGKEDGGLVEGLAVVYRR